jgi:predicted component of type VI protein secretion system
VEADAPADRTARLVRDRLELARAISAAVARSEGRLDATKREWLLELRDEIDRPIAASGRAA